LSGLWCSNNAQLRQIVRFKKLFFADTQCRFGSRQKAKFCAAKTLFKKTYPERVPCGLLGDVQAGLAKLETPPRGSRLRADCVVN